MQPQQQDNWQQPAQPASGEYHPEAPTVAEPSEPAISSPSPTTAPLQTSEVAMPSTPPEMEAASPRDGTEEGVRWQATEYIHRDKDARWYILFELVVIVMMALAIFVLKSWTFAVLIPVMAAALVVYTQRPPAPHCYTLTRTGLHIDDRLYSFEDFKEFGLVHGDDENSVLLVPRKRFAVGVTVYFPEEVGEAVIDMLAARLPMHEIRLDPIDRLVRRLRI